MAELATDPNEFCPSCGSWVEKLELESGWCSECTFGHHPDQKHTKWEIFLATHADRIEILMHQGLFLTYAVQFIRDEIRPNCKVCNEPLRGGKQDALFCRRHEYYSKRLERNKKKGMNDDEALQRALNVDTR
jgi:hypothetical protein